MVNTNPPSLMVPQTPQTMVPQESHSETHFLDYWQVLYSRKEIVIAVAILFILSGIIITRKMPRVYAAQTLIEVQRETSDIDIFTRAYSRYDPYFLKTQFEIIKSDPIIEQVVVEARLLDKLAPSYGWTAGSPKEAMERTISLVRRSTTLDIFQDTNLISITCKLSRPSQPDGAAAEVATSIANTIAKVFLDYTRNKNKVAVEHALDALQEEITQLDKEISKAEEDLAALRAKNKITLVGEGDSGAASYRTLVQKLTTQLNEAALVAQAKKKKYDSIVTLDPIRAGIVIPMLTGDASISTFLNDLQKLEMQATALKEEGYGAKNPEVIQNAALLKDVREKILDRVDTVKFGLKLDWELAQQTVDMYKANLDSVSKAEREISSGVAIQMERLQRELETKKIRRATIEKRVDDERVNLALPKTSVEIINLARLPEVPLPVSPNFALNVVLSVAAGLFFGIVLAYFVEYLDTTVKSIDDIENFFKQKALGVIPQKMRLLNDSSRNSNKIGEVFRILRMNVKTAMPKESSKTLLITSASAGEGKSTIAFNTAWTYAECGERTLLIDADIYHPRQHKICGVQQTPGLMNILIGEADLQSSIVPTGQTNFDFLPAGRIATGHGFGLLDTDEMVELLRSCAEHYDRVIVDSPPIIGVSDTAQLTRIVDGVAMVIQHRKYPRALIRRAKDTVISMGGNLIGMVLNNVNIAHDPSSYYYEHQYYYYYYTSDSKGNVSRTRRASTHQKKNAASSEASKS